MKKDVLKILKRYRVTDGKKFRLKDYDPADTAGLDFKKKEAQELLQTGVKRLAELQDKLYAQNHWSILVVFQAMDAAGKDGTIKHVMSGVNPQGVSVASFKAPSAHEINHDYLWRVNQQLPERGRIGIFNRSYYEEVLVTRVHPEILKSQPLPQELVGKNVYDERLEDIAAYERYLSRQGTVVLKFFLNVSQKEQKRRFLERIEDPSKNWKFSGSDMKERDHWKEYMAAYNSAISATASKHAPWYVVPADNKWFTRLIVVAAMIEAMEKLDLQYPTVSDETKAGLETAHTKLLND